MRIRKGDSDVEVTQILVVLRATWMGEVTKDVKLERQRQNPKGWAQEAKGLGPKDRKWHRSNEEFLPNVGKLKNRKKLVERGFKRKEPCERHCLRVRKAPAQGGYENQAWGHREGTKGEPLEGTWMCDHPPSRCCWSSQQNKMMSSQGTPKEVEGAGEVNTSPGRAWVFEDSFPIVNERS